MVYICVRKVGNDVNMRMQCSAVPKVNSETKRAAIKKKIHKYWPLYVLILPAVVYVFIFSYVPMYGLLIAFKDYRTSRGIWGSEWVGLKYFIKFVTYPNFWLIMRNTAKIGFYSLATFPCSVILALLINELNNAKFKKVVQMVTYAPYFLSTVVICSMVTLFFDKDSGVINNILALFGVERQSYLTVGKYFDDIYVWSGVWQTVGWGSIIYFAALSNVSPDLIEAAKVDGATRLQTVIHINIPSIMPTIIIMLILSCGRILSVGFEKTYLLQNSLNLNYSQVISTYTYEIGLAKAQFSYSAAIGLFNTVVNVAMLLVVNTIAKRVSKISLI